MPFKRVSYFSLRERGGGKLGPGGTPCVLVSEVVSLAQCLRLLLRNTAGPRRPRHQPSAPPSTPPPPIKWGVCVCVLQHCGMLVCEPKLKETELGQVLRQTWAHGGFYTTFSNTQAVGPIHVIFIVESQVYFLFPPPLCCCNTRASQRSVVRVLGCRGPRAARRPSSASLSSASDSASLP